MSSPTAPLTSPENLEKGNASVNVNQKRETLKLRGWPLLLLSFQALGIIYSDIGTSPLYVLNGIWPATAGAPSKEDVIGGISAIVWALTLLPLLKYVFISLEFGTGEGEGGTFALFQGLYPRADKDYDADRTLTGDSALNPAIPSEQPGDRRISKKARWPLLIWCLFGTSLTIADGVFTPAVSVTSAVGGIAVAKPSVNKDIIPISIALLVALFLGQRFGTGRIAFTYAPVACVWFLLLAGTGIYNITYYPAIFRAFDPSRAILLFVRTREYDLLAGILLAVTGCEAVFANLGQFNAFSIRLSFSTFVYPSLILAYLGQGARLVHDGEAVISNVFYNTIPGPPNGALFWVVFVFAILATIVASQALITATFSLVQQLIHSKCLPPIRMVYTSEVIQGQIYVPAVNWALMVAVIVVVAAFSNLQNLTNAYGFAVATVMFSTSVLIAVHIFYIKQLPLVLSFVYMMIFGFVDALFWGASLKKVPHGAWVPLVIGIVLLSLMLLWTWAKSLEDAFDASNRKNLRHFIQQDFTGKGATYHLKDKTLDVPLPTSDIIKDTASAISRQSEPELESDPTYYYTSVFGEKSDSGEMLELERRRLQRIPTCAIFHKIAEGKGVPHTFIAFIRQWPALPRVVVFLSVCIVPFPRVPPGDRYAVTKVRTIEGFYGVTYYVGFRDDFNVQVNEMIDKICEIETQINPEGSAAVVETIRSVSHTATHIAPHYHVVSRKVHVRFRHVSAAVNWMRTFLIEDIYRRLATMFPETGKWLTNADEIMHVGINAVI